MMRQPIPHGELVWIFAAFWIALGIASSAFFYLSKNASLKRQIYPPFIVGCGLLFALSAWLLTPNVPWFILVMIIVITFLNLRSVKFCDACGKTIHSSNPFSQVKLCPKCGAPIK